MCTDCPVDVVNRISKVTKTLVVFVCQFENQVYFIVRCKIFPVCWTCDVVMTSPQPRKQDVTSVLSTAMPFGALTLWLSLLPKTACVFTVVCLLVTVFFFVLRHYVATDVDDDLGFIHRASTQSGIRYSFSHIKQKSLGVQWFSNFLKKLRYRPLAIFLMAHGPLKKSTQINTKQHVGSNPELNFNSD